MPTSIHPPELADRYRATGAWPSTTLARRVAELAEASPDRVAIVDGVDDRTMTYRELVDDARRVAGFLKQRGVRPGDGVSVQLPNRYETVMVDIAVFLLGARLNPLLPNYRRNELHHILAASEAAVLVVPDEYRNFSHLALGLELLDTADTLHTLLVVGDDGRGQPTLTDALAAEPFTDDVNDDAGQISEIIFTSGTESAPKAVVHSEETLNHSVFAAADHIGLTDDDVVWMPSPIGHSTGLNFGVRMALMHGLTCVLQDRWDPHRAIELIQQHGASYTLAATTFLSDIVTSWSPGDDVGSMRHFGCGGAPVPKELVERAAEIGISVERLYGSTEGLIMSWTTPDSDPGLRGSHDGEVLAATELWVRDDSGNRVGPGEPGELVVRGPNVCLGFFNDPERTAESFDEDGWLSTGDLGSVDSDGRLTIVGRKKEIIIRGGLNIAPREIEDLIMQHPGVADVAIIGVPDHRLGELMCACIVPAAAGGVDFDTMIEFLEQRGLAKYKLPQRLVLLDTLPRTPTGKLQKFEIVQSMETGASE